MLTSLLLIVQIMTGSGGISINSLAECHAAVCIGSEGRNIVMNDLAIVDDGKTITISPNPPPEDEWKGRSCWFTFDKHFVGGGYWSPIDSSKGEERYAAPYREDCELYY